jgi:hypothetical protein
LASSAAPTHPIITSSSPIARYMRCVLNILHFFYSVLVQCSHRSCAEEYANLHLWQLLHQRISWLLKKQWEKHISPLREIGDLHLSSPREFHNTFPFNHTRSFAFCRGLVMLGIHHLDIHRRRTTNLIFAFCPVIE